MDDASRISSSSNCNGEPGVWIAKVSRPILKPKPRAVLRVEFWSRVSYCSWECDGSAWDQLTEVPLKRSFQTLTPKTSIQLLTSYHLKLISLSPYLHENLFFLKYSPHSPRIVLVIPGMGPKTRNPGSQIPGPMPAQCRWLRQSGRSLQ